MKYEDITVKIADTGTNAIEYLINESSDIILLSSTFPNISIADFTSLIREYTDTPLMLVSFNQSDIERAEALEHGVDEYIIVPFNPIELQAKVVALLRRSYGNGYKTERVIKVNEDITINLSTREVFRSGERLNLTPIEFQLLAELARNAGRVLTHEVLLEKIWGAEYSYDLSFVKKYIHRLRLKIKDDAANPQLIVNERGVGYKFIENSKS